jgi:putative heme iron utilization protein
MSIKYEIYETLFLVTFSLHRDWLPAGAATASTGETMSDSTTSSTNVKSIRHQKILDLAADQPDASLEDIAAEIPSATADLVDRVLDKYGDPANSDTTDDIDAAAAEATTATEPPEHEPSDNATESSTSEDADARPAVEDLTAKERETLRAIATHPDATQRDLAEILDISAATISNRVNAIPGFDWATRAAFTADLFDDADLESASMHPESTTTPAIADGATVTNEKSSTTDPDTDEAATDDGVQPPASAMTQTTVEQLSDRLTTIEEQLETIDRENTADDAPFTDPDLAHKVVHACLNSDAISEEEELRILRALLA